MRPADDPPVRTLIQRYHPWDELQNTALAIIDHTYAAALAIGGGVRDAASGIVTLSRPVDLVTITISPGTLHLARTGSGAVRRKNHANIRSSRGELAIVDAIVSRLDALIRAEKELLRKAAAAGCGSFPKMAEINQVFKVLQEMRREMDLEAVMRTRSKKRRVVEEIAGGMTTATMARNSADPKEPLTKRVRTLRVVDPRSRSRVEVLEQVCRSAT